ncbi:MAG: dihydroorotate dehydrogenase [Candidatus Marinimicrobia bacterium]|nr:dihydroorotate dehydrogenase [Candidatus Neomarinimicrobiota bacterium]
MIDLNTKLGNRLSLSNPILTASGTFGYGDEISDIVDVELYGGIVTKSLTLKPREGNPPPRIVETPSGMINSIGLANIGVDLFLEEKADFLKIYRGQVIINIAGRTDSEYCEILKRLTEENWIDGFEINVSCPNVSEGGIEFGTDPKILSNLARKLRDLTDKFLMIKLSPNVTDIRILAETSQKCGADAVSMINTVYGSAIDINTKKPLINSVIGGLSGPAIKPIAIANIIKSYRVIDIPIIGIGGISRGEDVIEFMLAGASAVQLGTVHFYNPLAINEILQFLEKYCSQNNILSIGDIIGKVEI